MATIIEALDLFASKGWEKEWQNPAWKQFILTGNDKHLKKLPEFSDDSNPAEELLSAVNPLRIQRLIQITPKTGRLGLHGLTTGLANVVDHPQSRALLRCSYLSQLHRRAMVLYV